MYAIWISLQKHICILQFVLVVSFVFTIRAGDPNIQELTPIFEISSKQGIIKLGLKDNAEKSTDQSASKKKPVFYAVTSDSWPTGLIPIYQTRQKDGTFKLTRRLSHGRENFVEPLFFALPPRQDTHVSKLSGRWSCEAKHHDGSVDFLNWEMTLVDHSIVGRFDQETDYRFAWLMEGHFDDPTILLRVEYIDAKYELIGKLNNSNLEGTWRHMEDGDGGIWRAEPANHLKPFPDTFHSISLFNNEQAPTQNHVWHIGEENSPAGSMLCLVWLPNKSSVQEQ